MDRGHNRGRRNGLGTGCLRSCMPLATCSVTNAPSGNTHGTTTSCWPALLILSSDCWRIHPLPTLYNGVFSVTVGYIHADDRWAVQVIVDSPMTATTGTRRLERARSPFTGLGGPSFFKYRTRSIASSTPITCTGLRSRMHWASGAGNDPFAYRGKGIYKVLCVASPSSCFF